MEHAAGDHVSYQHLLSLPWHISSVPRRRSRAWLICHTTTWTTHVRQGPTAPSLECLILSYVVALIEPRYQSIQSLCLPAGRDLRTRIRRSDPTIRLGTRYDSAVDGAAETRQIFLIWPCHVAPESTISRPAITSVLRSERLCLLIRLLQFCIVQTANGDVLSGSGQRIPQGPII